MRSVAVVLGGSALVLAAMALPGSASASVPQVSAKSSVLCPDGDDKQRKPSALCPDGDDKQKKPSVLCPDGDDKQKKPS